MSIKLKICGILALCYALGLKSTPLYVFSEKCVDQTKQAWLSCAQKPNFTTGSPLRVISEKGFFYEDFESMKPGLLDSGWTTSATPGLPNDCWSVATLGTDGDGMSGTSGYQYAYILGNRDPKVEKGHDAWLFSPGVECEGGREYRLEFFTYMAAGGNVIEYLDVALLSAPNRNSVIKTLAEIEDGEGQWKQNIYTFTPEEDGVYYIGFHSTSPHMANATLIDDVTVSSGSGASFLGAAGVDMGDVDMVAGTFSAPYVIENRGLEPMEVSVKSTSPEVSIVGLPITIPAQSKREITIEFTPSKLGKYVGQYTLSTSDRRFPEVELMVMANVKDVPVTNFHVEDFESGGPQGWSMSFGSVNTDFVPGNFGPRCYYIRSFYALDEEDEIGFTTHYYQMGDDPEFSFWYRAMACNLLGEISGPAAADYPQLDFYVTDDMGKTWVPLYSITPGTKTAHKPSDKFQKVTVDASAYAGKTCRFKMVMHNAGNALEHDFLLQIDDLAAGTRPEVELGLSALYGPSALRVGEKCDLSVTVTNQGLENSGAFSVDFRDAQGNVLTTANCDGVEPGECTKVNASWTPSSAENLAITAVASHSSDPISSNNTSNILHAQVLAAECSRLTIDNSDMYASAAFPINFSAKESETQTIYYANELGIDKGQIESVTFASGFNYPLLTENFELWIGETDAADFSAGNMIPNTGFTRVFSGKVYMPAEYHEFTLPFDTPYQYKGGNVVLMTRKCSDETINTKQFIVHRSNQPRTITAITNTPGTLASGGYESRESVEAYAHALFNMVKADAGSVAGRVTDQAGKPVETAIITLEGTRLTCESKKDGNYNFAEVSVGQHGFSAVKYGYYPSSGNQVSVSKGGNVNLDITLTPYPISKLSGTVRTVDGFAVEGAKVILKGYSDYSVLTDAEGYYEINVYGDTGEDYDMCIETLHFQTFWNHSLTVGKSDQQLDVTLEEEVQPVFNVNASASEGKAETTWEAPLTEFRHDSGEEHIDSYLGWAHGHARCGIFSTYRQHMLVKEIRFWLSDHDGPHSDINVFLVGLNTEGYPNPQDMKWLVKAVPFTDNAWTTITLDEPVDIANFAIGISGTGCIGLGCTAADPEHPFSPLMHFWAGDDMYNPYDLMDFSIWKEIHPMLRVYGDYLGNPATDDYHISRAPKLTRPMVDYDVYCVDEGSTENMELLGTTRELSFNDLAFGTRSGNIRYAVVARYTTGSSDPVYSNLLTSTGVETLPYADITFGPNPFDQYLEVSQPENVRSIDFFSVDGRHSLSIKAVSNKNDVSRLPQGIYMVAVTFCDGNVRTEKMIKK